MTGKRTARSSRGRIERLREQLDSWFATLVRYCGLGMMAEAVFVDHLRHIALVTAASGMILFKSVWGK